MRSLQLNTCKEGWTDCSESIAWRISHFPLNNSLHIKTFLIIGLILLVSAARAQDDFFNTIDVDIQQSDSDGPVQFFGWVTEKVAYGLEAPGPLFSRSEREINRIETNLYGQLDIAVDEQTAMRFSARYYHDEVYRWNDDTPYTEDEINTHRNRYEIRDFYIEHQTPDDVYFKLGNQLLVWGQSEYLRITDLINIENQFFFAQQDLEDLRLQIPAMLVSFDLGDWVFDSVVTYKAGSNNIGPAGDEFDQFIRIRETGARILLPQTEQESEYFFRASTRLRQGDLQLVAGEFNDNALSVSRLAALDTPTPEVSFRQNRMRALGVSANWVEGSWLYFGELGLHRDKAVRPNFANFFSQVHGWEQKHQILAAAGVEYNGFRNLVVTFELDSIHTQSHSASMLAKQDQVSAGVRLYWTALNERLQVLGVWNELANNTGRVVRLSADYNWSDSLDFGLLWVDYSTGESSPFEAFRFNDVIQLQLRYSFQL